MKEKQQMIVNIINSYRDTVAIADKELIGKQFFEDKKQLDVKESFYSGENSEEMTEEQVKKTIIDWVREDATFNIVGKKSISLALKINLINEECVGKIKGIPYAMVLL